MTAPKSLEEALGTLDLQDTLVLMGILTQRAITLRQEELMKTKVHKSPKYILTPNTTLVT